MKTNIIVINWTLALVGLSVDTEATPLWGSLLMFAWFIAASIPLIYISKKDNKS